MLSNIFITININQINRINEKLLPCELFILKIMMRRGKILDPRNSRKKKSWIHETPKRKILDIHYTNEKNLGPKKYPLEKILDLRNAHKKKL